MQDFKNLKISTRYIAEAALKRNWGVVVVDANNSLLKLTIPGVRRGVIVHSTAPLSTSYGSSVVADDKWATYNILVNNNIPTPKTLLVLKDYNIKSIEVGNLLNSNNGLAVKPVDTNQGIGITLNIYDKEKLKIGLDLALQFSRCKECIVQEMVKGEDYRFLVVDGKVCAVTKRVPAFVVGDGIKSVLGLIEDLNNSPDRSSDHSTSLACIPVDAAKKLLKDSIHKVPKVGENVTVCELANVSLGGTPINVTNNVDDNLKNIAIEVSNIFGLSVCGVDILYDGVNYNVIEINYAPGLRLHYMAKDYENEDVAQSILDNIKKQALHLDKVLNDDIPLII